MSNKNFNHNDNESFMEGIYGCLERIEIGIIELQKSKPSDSNSVVDNEANETLVEEIKALVTNATGLNCRQEKSLSIQFFSGFLHTMTDGRPRS